LSNIFSSIACWPYWDSILSLLVIIHLCSEYVHYFLEYFSGKKETNILKDIHIHRKSSNKTKRLQQIQSDLDLIKKVLKIKEDDRDKL